MSIDQLEAGNCAFLSTVHCAERYTHTHAHRSSRSREHLLTFRLVADLLALALAAPGVLALVAVHLLTLCGGRHRRTRSANCLQLLNAHNAQVACSAVCSCCTAMPLVLLFEGLAISCCTAMPLVCCCVKDYIKQHLGWQCSLLQ